MKSIKYMKSEEFKARQSWLPFVDAVGIALQIMSEVKEATADWFKAWVKDFRTPLKIQKPDQLSLNFLGWIRLGEVLQFTCKA